MRILYLLDESWDSGLSASALTLVGLLRQKGVDSQVLCRKKSYAERICRERGFPHLVFNGPWLFSLGKIAEWVQKQGFQILHSHTGRTHTLAHFLKRRLPNVKIFRTRADARETKRRRFYSKILSSTAFVVFPSKKLREEFLVTYDYPMNRTKVIYPTIENELDKADKPYKADKTIVSLVGRLDPVKGQEDFICAASLLAPRFPQVSFEIVGAEKNTKMVNLTKLARRLGVAAKVHLHGFLEDEDLDRLMKGVTVAVIASRGSEAVSRVTLEWMRLGKPIVATKVGVVPELLEGGPAGLLVEPNSPEELAYAVGKFLADEKLREDFGEKAKEIFQERFDSSVCFNEHLTLYQEAVSC